VLELHYSVTAEDLESAWRVHRPLWTAELPAATGSLVVSVFLLTASPRSPLLWFMLAVSSSGSGDISCSSSGSSGAGRTQPKRWRP